MRAITHSIWVFFMLMLVAGAPQAKDAPDILLKNVTQQLISELRTNDKEVKNNPSKIYDIINRILVPHVDWQAMSQWVVGRNAWNSASPQDRQQFSNEFKNLLIRTYASTLRAYNNQNVEYLPVRGGFQGKNRVQIQSRIKEPGKEAIKVAYRMADKGDSWKVYDISIEGVSLLKGFQSQFAQEVQQKGLPALTMRLRQHNEKPLR